MMYENKNFISEVSTKVIETRDEFIFQTISSWIVNNHQITVSKETLSKAVALIKMMEDRGVDICEIISLHPRQPYPVVPGQLQLLLGRMVSICGAVQ